MNIIPRVSISEKIRVIVTRIVITATLILSAVAIYSLFSMRKISSQTMIKEMETNVTAIASSKVYIAELGLRAYSDYVSEFSKLATAIYDNPEDYPKVKVNPIDKEVWEEYRLQRNLASTDYKLSDVEEEMSRLANIDTQWWLLMESYGDYVSTVYLGTETGFLLSYDKYSYLADISPDGEVYFNYLERNWYKKAKEANETIFTDLSQDYFGRGLTLTCAAPFYNKGKFAGVVAMDILVGDLQKSIIDIDLGEGTYGFLVDTHDGNIIASPFIDKKQTTFENINNKENEFYPFADNILSGESGLALSGNTYVAYAPINAADWMLCIKIPRELILEPVKIMDSLIIKIIIVFIIIFIVIQIFSYFMVRRVAEKISSPILDLKYDVEEISGGNLNYVARVEGNDEISDLANAFNNMTFSLKNYINDLTSLTAEKERIGAELNVATHIQSSMLPSIFPAFPSDKRFDIYATMNPAKEVGGDFYDFFMVDEKHIAIVVADVSGKGVPAALFMVIGKTLIKDHTGIEKNLSDVFFEVNNMLCESNSEDLFITAFEAIINIETGYFTYVNAGHEMPFIYKKGKEWTAHQMKPGFVLAGMENMKFTTGDFYLEPGDKIFQYTDGVTEATNSNNELYGMDRLKNALDANTDKTMNELLLAIKEDIDKFVGEAPQFDDITMLGFEFKGI